MGSFNHQWSVHAWPSMDRCFLDHPWPGVLRLRQWRLGSFKRTLRLPGELQAMISDWWSMMIR